MPDVLYSLSTDFFLCYFETISFPDFLIMSAMVVSGRLSYQLSWLEYLFQLILYKTPCTKYFWTVFLLFHLILFPWKCVTQCLSDVFRLETTSFCICFVFCSISVVGHVAHAVCLAGVLVAVAGVDGVALVRSSAKSFLGSDLATLLMKSETIGISVIKDI